MTTTTAPAAPTTVSVDVVDRESGRAIVIIEGRGLQAAVGREDVRRLYVEDVDTEERVGTTNTYRNAGVLFARHHGITDYLVVVEYED
jgi:hypothetical protein